MLAGFTFHFWVWFSATLMLFLVFHILQLKTQFLKAPNFQTAQPKTKDTHKPPKIPAIILHISDSSEREKEESSYKTHGHRTISPNTHTPTYTLYKMKDVAQHITETHTQDMKTIHTRDQCFTDTLRLWRCTSRRSRRYCPSPMIRSCPCTCSMCLHTQN